MNKTIGEQMDNFTNHEDVLISEYDAIEFVRRYQKAKAQANASGYRTYNSDYDGSLRLSFDGNWQPFIGESLGFNRKCQRYYIDNCEITKRISSVMKSRSLNNFDRGRVFFSPAYVCVKVGGSKIPILKWVVVKNNFLKTNAIRDLSKLRNDLKAMT